MTNSETEIYTNGSKEMCEEFLETASFEKRDHLSVLFAEILRVIRKKRPCKSRHHELVKVIVGTLDSLMCASSAQLSSID